LTTLPEGHSPYVQVRVWHKVPEAYRALADDEGVVRARNEGVWVAGTKETPGSTTTMIASDRSPADR
jgi:hypothetical protein